MNTEFNAIWSQCSPRVSVITPVYNRREELPRTLRSVENQTYRNIEYIIVDDGSTLPVDDIVKDFMIKADFPVAFIKKQNGGVHTARNAGIRISRGNFFA